MDLPVDFLRTFVLAADHGSFTLAARDAGRTQSAVSQQIKKLEEQIGRTLFTRGPKALTLTTAGESLMPYARRMVKLHREAVSALTEPDMSGTVRLGVLDDYAPFCLPPVLEAFAADYPRVQLEVRCGYTSRYLMRLMEAGELDLAIHSGAAVSAGARLLGLDPLVWVASANHLAHEKDPVPLAVFDKQCVYRRWALDALEKAGRAFRVCYTSASVSGVMAAVTAGLAVAPLGLSSVSEDLLILGQEHGFPPLPVSSIMMTYHADASEPVKRLGDAVKAGLTEGMASRRMRGIHLTSPAD